MSREKIFSSEEYKEKYKQCFSIRELLKIDRSSNFIHNFLRLCENYGKNHYKGSSTKLTILIVHEFLMK